MPRNQSNGTDVISAEHLGSSDVYVQHNECLLRIHKSERAKTIQRNNDFRFAILIKLNIFIHLLKAHCHIGYNSGSG